MRTTPRWSVRSLTVAGVFACAAVACGPAPASTSLPPAGLDDAGYFAVADHLQSSSTGTGTSGAVTTSRGRPEPRPRSTATC